MADYHFETLAPTDYGFLLHESPSEPMHVTGLALFDAGPLAEGPGAVNFEKLKQAVADVLHKVPRYRQKLLWVAGESGSMLGQVAGWMSANTDYPPVWVDDPEFDIDYHVRHACLPHPGDEQQLKTLVSRISSRQLDRARPLWEVYIIEGLPDGRFACLTRMHHCMVDGESGIDLTAVLMHIDPGHVPEPGPAYQPRPAPTQQALKRELRKAQYLKPWQVIKDLQAYGTDTDRVGRDLLVRTTAIGRMLKSSVGQRRHDSPLNGASSAQRICDWLDLPLARVKAAAKARDATVNDAVLAIVTGAVRAYCLERDFDVATIPFSVSAPVSMRRHTGKQLAEGEIGNEVTQWTVNLPIHEAAAVKQMALIHAETAALKNSNAVLATQTLTNIFSLYPALMGTMIGQATAGVNTMVTNMPGPQFPLYQCGAEMLSARPIVPLNSGLGMVIGVLSYNGTISFGLNSDPAIIADISEFRELLERAYKALIKDAGPARKKRSSTTARRRRRPAAAKRAGANR